MKDMVKTATADLEEGAVRICVLLDNVYGMFRVAEMVSMDRHERETTTSWDTLFLLPNADSTPNITPDIFRPWRCAQASALGKLFLEAKVDHTSILASAACVHERLSTYATRYLFQLTVIQLRSHITLCTHDTPCSLDPDSVAAHLRLCNTIVRTLGAPPLPGAACVSPSELVRQRSVKNSARGAGRLRTCSGIHNSIIPSNIIYSMVV